MKVSFADRRVRTSTRWGSPTSRQLRHRLRHHAVLLPVATGLALATVLVAAGSQPAYAIPIEYDAVLSGAAEDPPVISPATGTARVDLDLTAHTLRVRFDFDELLGPLTVAHIHACTAVPGSGNAPVATQVPTFTGTPAGATSGTYDQTFDTSQASTFNPAYITGNGGTPASAEAALAACIAAGGAYLNLHTTLYGGGEIRGFLRPWAGSWCTAVAGSYVDETEVCTVTGSVPGNVAVPGTGVLSIVGPSTFSGVISGSGQVRTSGAVFLSGANTFSGPLTVQSASTLSLVSVGALPAFGSVIIEAGGTLALQSAGATGSATVRGTLAGPATLTASAVAVDGGTVDTNVTATTFTMNCNSTVNVTPTVATISDSCPLELNLPSSITQQATSADGIAVTFTATATDRSLAAPKTQPAVTCVPASGSVFPVGTTAVSCTATDTGTNVTAAPLTGVFSVVVLAPSPTTVPTTAVPGATVAPGATAAPTSAAPAITVPPTGILPETGADQGGTIALAALAALGFGALLLTIARRNATRRV